MPDFFTSGGFLAFLVLCAIIALIVIGFTKYMNNQKERRLTPRERESMAVRQSREITRQI